MTKVFLSFILVALFLLLTPTAFAQAPVPAYVSPTSPIYTDLLVHNLFHSFSCLSIGSSVIGKPCLSYQNGIPVLSKVDLSGGALGGTTSLIGLLYKNPPVRTIDYLASVGQGFGFVKEAHAQVTGSGAGVLNPILNLWGVSRNIAYVFMIIIFVIIGLMVMFRQRINPQTVITAQAALPGLVIGLIMITFSFFLAGLISDMAFVGTNVVGYYFSQAGGSTTAGKHDISTGLENDKNILSIFSSFTRVADKDVISNALSSIWDNFNESTQQFLTGLSTMVSFQLSSGATEAVKTIPSGVPRPGKGQSFGIPGGGQLIQTIAIFGTGLFALKDPTAMVGILLFIVTVAILLLSMFKLLLRLINNYLSIVFLTITAPFYFMAAALPGRQSIATGWILNMLCNILAFPAVLALFYFVAYILSNTQANIELAKLPFQFSNASGVAGTQTFPLFGGLDLSFVSILLAFGALVASPSIPDIICRTIGRVGVAGQLIGQEISGSVASGRGYGQSTSQGIAAASQYFAQGRGLFETAGWKRQGGGEGKPDRIEKVREGYGYSPGLLTRAGSSIGGWWQNRKQKATP